MGGREGGREREGERGRGGESGRGSMSYIGGTVEHGPELHEKSLGVACL